jgi:hypothetical protein
LKPRAWFLLRPEPRARFESFGAGLEAAGFQAIGSDVHQARISFGTVRPGEVLLIWNRYGAAEELAKRFEEAGGTVIVAENGYLGRDENGAQNYALAVKGHNGSGVWPAGSPERWERLGIEVRPWREKGDHILVCPNRSFGPKGVAMPQDWGRDAITRLRQRTRRPIRLRPHPGNWQVKPPEVPLERDLEGAWAVVIWASSAGLHALTAGVPVIAEGPFWVAKSAAFSSLEEVEKMVPAKANAARQAALERVAAAQWTLREIASGEAFRRLLACA